MKLSRLISCEKDVEITGLSVDSRTVKRGDLFICLSGEKLDGHAYARAALAKGAAAVLTERRIGVEKEITVLSTRKAAATLYSRWYGEPQNRLRLYGVTGTNGKTSTVAALNAIYCRVGVETGVMGTIASAWGGRLLPSENTTALPEILYSRLKEMADAGVKRVFMEVSSHALSLDRTCEISFAYGVYTNLTRDHLDFHKSMEEYALAKEKLFQQSRVGIFNYDDKCSYIASQKCKGERYGYGTDAEADFRLEEVWENGLDGAHFAVRYQGKRFLFSTPLAGNFNIYNLLAAISVALHEGVDYGDIAEAVSDFRGAKGRMEKIYGGDFAVFIDYAHTPDALMRVLQTLRRAEPKRLRVLFGCGGDRDRSKRPIMGEIAERLADDVIVTTDNSRSESPDAIIEDIVKGMSQTKLATRFKVIKDRRKALEYAIQTAIPGDVILVAGKGHEEYEIDCSGRHSFSERSILLSQLKACGYL